MMKQKVSSSISQAEFERRKSLHEQFVQQIESLADTDIQLIVFSLGADQFAIEIGKVHEVVRTPKVTSLPKTPGYIKGVGQVMGTNIIMLDLAEKLGLAFSASNWEDRSDYCIIVSSERFTVGIIVPEVPQSIKCRGNIIQPTGHEMAGTPEDETYIKGLINWKGDQLFFIDIDELIEGDRLRSRVD